MCFLAVGGCQTTEDAAEDYHDEPFKSADNPHTTVFKYIKNFSGQDAALGQYGGVRTIRYSQGGKFVGNTQFAVDSWFGRFTEGEMKNRLGQSLKRKFPSAETSPQAFSTYRNLEDFGVYTEKNGCVFMSFYKRLKGSGIADNDDGAPDFLGTFIVCGGLTVSPEKFIQSIDQARDSDIPAFIRASKK